LGRDSAAAADHETAARSTSGRNRHTVIIS